MTKKQLFIAEVLKEANIAGQPSYCEVSFVLIKAETSTEAKTIAETFGKESERPFINPNNETVIWKFIRVIDISPSLSEEIGGVSEIHAHIYKNMSSYETALSLRKLD